MDGAKGSRSSRRVAFFAVAVLLAVGITMVLSATYLYGHQKFSDGTYFWRRHLLAVGVGTTALLFFAFLPFEVLRRFTYPLVALTLVLLALVLVAKIGIASAGDKGWLSRSGFASTLSEIAKPCLVLYLAHSLAAKGERVSSFVGGILAQSIVCSLFLALIIVGGDFGTALLLGLVVFLMLLIAGVKFSHLMLLGSLALFALALLVIGADDGLKGFLTLLDPWRDPSGSGLQLIQSYLAFGSGQIWGRGLGESRQKLFYLPNAYTDLMFSVIGEELGVLGAFVILALFCVIIARGLIVTAKTDEPFNRYLAFGLTNLLGLQALIHMGVSIGLIGTRGLPLPFVSYGGTAMVMNLIEVGVLLSVSRRRL